MNPVVSNPRRTGRGGTTHYSSSNHALTLCGRDCRKWSVIDSDIPVSCRHCLALRSQGVRSGQFRSGIGGSPDTIHVTEKRKGQDLWNCVFRSAVLIDRQDDNEYLTREEIEKSFPVIENMSVHEFYDSHRHRDEKHATESSFIK